MSLKEYARKRDFEKTPEPGPAEAGPPDGAPSFYIQRHDATRLHYDFRLEINGTLKSWAVPKGPTLDPAPKRLAAMVEDHPLDYGEFEGNIPRGQYGGGSVMLWDRGTFELLGDVSALKQIERGDLKFRLHGEKLKGEFAIVLMKGRGKGNEWLLLKKRDAFAKPGWDVEEHAVSVKTGRTQEEIAKDLPSRKVAIESDRKPSRRKRTQYPPMPAEVAPMMASVADRPPRGDHWLFEIKWDGVRGLCFIENDELRILSRNGNRCERQYPELSVLPHYVEAEQAILDGEIAVLDERGVSSFALIQPRIMNQDPNSVAHMARKTPVHLFLFDLLWLDGEDWRRRPLRERKKKLAEIVKPHELIRVSDAFEGTGEEILEAARQYGLEGLVAKKDDSPYEPKRSKDWLKIKLVNEQDLVICGFLKKKREYFGSLILGSFEDRKLRHAGQVGTGFVANMIELLFRKLEPLVTEKCPFARVPKIPGEVVWVRPELVAKVKYLSWTKDHILRAPVFLGLREDIDPKKTVDAGEDSRGEPSGEVLHLAGKEATVDVDGRRLKFTNLGKILFPKDGYTKRDLLSYYDSVSNWLLPHLKDRPLSLKRYPNGIHEPYFFQKDSPASFPEWLRFETIEDTRFVLADDRAALLYLANLACIDHNPFMSRVGSIGNPDWILIDLDPQECSFDRIVEAALLVRKKLDLLELEGYPKTTGGDGMHIYIPVEPHYSYEETKSFAEVIARTLAGERPDLFTTPRSVSKRQKNRVYFDYLQNGEGKTIAAPYVTRAYDGAPVATPLRWDEVKLGLYPTMFTIRNAPQRFEAMGDLFAGVLRKPQSLHEAAERFHKLVTP